jgi:hypothetical protein
MSRRRRASSPSTVSCRRFGRSAKDEGAHRRHCRSIELGEDGAGSPGGGACRTIVSLVLSRHGESARERKKVNSDHPDALDWELLHEHLQAIAAGRAFDEPVYSFADYARTTGTRRIEPGEFLIVEGLFVLYWPELRGMLETKVYVETDPVVCYQRRLRRDVAERGRTPESVREVRAHGASER